MYIPHYQFSAPTKSINDTQKVMHTIKETHIFAFFVTVPVSYTHLTLPTKA